MEGNQNKKPWFASLTSGFIFSPAFESKLSTIKKCEKIAFGGLPWKVTKTKSLGSLRSPRDLFFLLLLKASFQRIEKINPGRYRSKAFCFVGVRRLELPAPTSRTWYATNCATPRAIKFKNKLQI
jgi:hypothetical protein